MGIISIEELIKKIMRQAVNINNARQWCTNEMDKLQKENRGWHYLVDVHKGYKVYHVYHDDVVGEILSFVI